MLVTACLFPLSCFSIAFVLNTIAIFYQVGGAAVQCRGGGRVGRRAGGWLGGEGRAGQIRAGVQGGGGGQDGEPCLHQPYACSSLPACWGATTPAFLPRTPALPSRPGLTAALPLFCALSLLQSLAAVPFGSIVIVLLIWMFISFPLCLFGTVVGRNWAGAPNHPCRWGGGEWGRVQGRAGCSRRCPSCCTAGAAAAMAASPVCMRLPPIHRHPAAPAPPVHHPQPQHHMLTPHAGCACISAG